MNTLLLATIVEYQRLKTLEIINVCKYDESVGT